MRAKYSGFPDAQGAAQALRIEICAEKSASASMDRKPRLQSTRWFTMRCSQTGGSTRKIACESGCICRFFSIFATDINFETDIVFPKLEKDMLKRKTTTLWTLELASKLEDAPWPATKEELVDYAIRSGAPLEVLENLQEIEDEGDIYESIEDIWPDYPSKDDFFFNEEEY